MEENTNDQLSEEVDKGFEIPKLLKLIITLLTSLFSIFVFSIYAYLIFWNPDYLEPEKYGLPSLLIFSLTILFAINFPWMKLGLQITKIGSIELSQKVKGQAKIVNKDLADLQLKIDELEKKIGITPPTLENDLADLLLLFLSSYSRWSFSPLRIKKWGSIQNGFSDLNKYSLEQITTELKRLLAQNKVSTRISKTGNTLYVVNV